MNTTEKNSELMDYEFSRHSGSKRKYFATGIIVFLLALTGIVLIVISGVKMGISKSEEKKETEINSYNSFLIPVCAVDPHEFDDLVTADVSELIEIAVWSIIGSDRNPEGYDYSSGELAIPQSDIENAYNVYFGNTVPIVHQTVEGYGYRFEYSEDDACYYIPLTGITPVYTPSVISVEEKNGVKIITCGMIYSGSWQQDYSTGKMVIPDPDKYITVTIRTKSTGSYISSIGTVGNIK